MGFRCQRMSLFSSGIVHHTEQTGVLPTRTKAHWENGSPPIPLCLTNSGLVQTTML